jgi:sirohydrochlorin ferrochelatase
LSGTDEATGVGLLIAAHGERSPGATNEGVRRIAQAVAAHRLFAEVGVGFINGTPTIGEAFAALTVPRIIVYPLFAWSGYFSRDRLVQLLDEANDQRRDVEVLPPLGLDPGLPELVLDRAREVARDHGFAPETSTIILLAHGSRRNSASREATEQVARAIEHRVAFRSVGIALLEERPFLVEAAALAQGPAIVVGMFSGEGMHGASDGPRLIAELNRKDVVYAGVIGNFVGIEDVVVGAVAEAVGIATSDARDRPTTS